MYNIIYGQFFAKATANDIMIYYETNAVAKAKTARAKETWKPSRKLIRMRTKSLPGFRRRSIFVFTDVCAVMIWPPNIQIWHLLVISSIQTMELNSCQDNDPPHRADIVGKTAPHWDFPIYVYLCHITFLFTTMQIQAICRSWIP